VGTRKGRKTTRSWQKKKDLSAEERKTLPENEKGVKQEVKGWK